MSNDQSKFCYCFLVHQDSVILDKLVSKLLQDQRSVVSIHVDKKQPAIAQLLQEKFSDFDRVIVISKVKVFWGHYSMCTAMQQLIESSISKWPALIRITFLSGQHYLLTSAQRINDFFLHHHDEQFVETFDMHSERWIKTGVYKRRYSYYWPFPPKLYVNTIVRAINRLVKINRKIPQGMHPYSGSQWISITKPAAEYIIKMMEQADIKDFYCKTFIPDEMLFHTLIANSEFKHRLKHQSLTYVKWVKDGTPKYLNDDDYDDIFKALSKENFFARKFDTNHSMNLIKKFDSVQ